jgi:hypothetical protein
MAIGAYPKEISGRLTVGTRHRSQRGSRELFGEIDTKLPTLVMFPICKYNKKYIYH